MSARNNSQDEPSADSLNTDCGWITSNANNAENTDSTIENDDNVYLEIEELHVDSNVQKADSHARNAATTGDISSRNKPPIQTAPLGTISGQVDSSDYMKLDQCHTAYDPYTRLPNHNNNTNSRCSVKAENAIVKIKSNDVTTASKKLGRFKATWCLLVAVALVTLLVVTVMTTVMVLSTGTESGGSGGRKIGEGTDMGDGGATTANTPTTSATETALTIAVTAMTTATIPTTTLPGENMFYNGTILVHVARKVLTTYLYG